nr:atrial natriuretic peptide receptor 2-like [Nerophis lumbriciformis]
MALWTAVSFFLAYFLGVHCWHDLDNTEYDCWPSNNPNDYNMISCGGLEMAWVQRPPEKVTNGEEFNVSYTVTASDSFYDYAVRNKIFQFSDAAEAKRFCHDHECPSNWNNANEINCCVYHANIHSCPLGLMKQGGICGPWIPDDGKIVTHTVSKAGKMSQKYWTSKVVLIHVGVTSVIAHIKIGQMHAALESKVLVVSAQVCGDDVCELEENCLNCPADCGICPMSMAIKVSIGLPVAFFSAGFILTMVWLQYQKQKMFWDESWIIDYKSRVFGTDFGSTNSPQHFKSTSNVSQLTDITMCTGVNTFFKQGFIQPGIYDGRTVAVKHLQKKHFALSKSIRKEVKEVRQLDHPNLCKFIGGSIEVPYVAIITEHCPKGSLSDVLLNDDIPINWGFRLSFATDIARGMSYLHQHKMFHGQLHSRNCVIDDRWVCKISDYGLTLYRKEDFDVVSNAFTCGDINRVYCAPEVLLGSSSTMTQAADVYSYAMILVEIATRSDLISAEGVRMDVIWRPPLPELKAGKTDVDCPSQEDYCELIKKCWSHNLATRPTFEQVKKMLDKMNPHKVSPVDMMMNLMEKYSKHLEAIVAERTQDLLQEKQKTDRLLYSMLPKPVADDLRQGRTAEAQSFSNATVYFSDIVGFTQLSGASTPHQVVDFLNQLYTTFDDIIDNYGVYKVETIGDAYMVVSGVPQENGINHAGEIASMALDLVNVCHTFKIPHKPNTQLKIRAGIHSGPVVAGVVGTKMPRYCLFGDTVNTASRMESTSEALKIQVSGATADLLHTLRGYILTCRGMLNVKGKGEMKTWWLEAKRKECTDPLLSTSESTGGPVPVSD